MAVLALNNHCWLGHGALGTLDASKPRIVGRDQHWCTFFTALLACTSNAFISVYNCPKNKIRQYTVPKYVSGYYSRMICDWSALTCRTCHAYERNKTSSPTSIKPYSVGSSAFMPKQYSKFPGSFCCTWLAGQVWGASDRVLTSCHSDHIWDYNIMPKWSYFRDHDTMPEWSFWGPWHRHRHQDQSNKPYRQSPSRLTEVSSGARVFSKSSLTPGLIFNVPAIAICASLAFFNPAK